MVLQQELHTVYPRFSARCADMVWLARSIHLGLLSCRKSATKFQYLCRAEGSRDEHATWRVCRWYPTIHEFLAISGLRCQRATSVLSRTPCRPVHVLSYISY